MYEHQKKKKMKLKPNCASVSHALKPRGPIKTLLKNKPEMKRCV